MKHAILITAHTNFSILQLLIDTLDSENFDFYIIIDKKVKICDYQIIKRPPLISKLLFLPRIQINWGGYSQIKAYMNLIEYSVTGHYDYYHFLQGSDFPVRTKEEIESYFKNNRGKEFIEIIKKDTVSVRCCYYHFFVDNKYYRDSKILKTLDLLCVSIQRRLGISRNKDLAIYFGSAIHSLTHDCVSFLISKKKEIHTRFTFTRAADEIFVQSLIAMSPFKNNIYKGPNGEASNARLIDWKRRVGFSPHTFTSKDYDMLISADNGACFARKFDENVDMDVVSKLYKYLNH